MIIIQCHIKRMLIFIQPLNIKNNYQISILNNNNDNDNDYNKLDEKKISKSLSISASPERKYSPIQVDFC